MGTRSLRPLAVLAAVLAMALGVALLTSAAPGDRIDPPASTPKLIFIHHSCGENWLADDDGGLGIALRDAGYFVSDTNYGWGPVCEDCEECWGAIGDCTDTLHWDNWFSDSGSDVVLGALYAEFGQASWYSRCEDPDPARENEIILFKSCYPNSNLSGSPEDPPAANGEELSVGRAKAMYLEVLAYFATRQDKLFVAITAPPVAADDSWEDPANARAFNDWLVNSWLADYPHANVAVFDFYNVLTSNGGDPYTNDADSEAGNHHRWWDGAVQHTQTVHSDLAAYGGGDSHPTSAGNRKATAEFLPLLNVYYHRWQADRG